MTENPKQNQVIDCLNHRDKVFIFRRLKKIKGSSGLVKSLKSETDDGFSSCSNFPERPTLDEMQRDKPVLLEIEHLRGKITDEQLEASRMYWSGMRMFFRNIRQTLDVVTSLNLK